MTNQLPDDEMLLLLEFWTEQLERVRQLLCNEAIWLRWYVEKGQGTFTTWATYRQTAEWKDALATPRITDYLATLPILRQDWDCAVLPFAHKLHQDPRTIDAQDLLDVSLLSVLLLPPTLAYFDAEMANEMKVQQARRGRLQIGRQSIDIEWYLS